MLPIWQHISIFTTFEKQSMINRLSNPINRNRSAAKISKVMSSTVWCLILECTSWPEVLGLCLILEFETILFPNFSFWSTTTELSLSVSVSLSSLYGGPGQAWDRDFKMTMIMNVLQTKNE